MPPLQPPAAVAAAAGVSAAAEGAARALGDVLAGLLGDAGLIRQLVQGAALAGGAAGGASAGGAGASPAAAHACLCALEAVCSLSQVRSGRRGAAAWGACACADTCGRVAGALRAVQGKAPCELTQSHAHLHTPSAHPICTPHLTPPPPPSPPPFLPTQEHALIALDAGWLAEGVVGPLLASPDPLTRRWAERALCAMFEATEGC